jgi:hypothetical protein
MSETSKLKSVKQYSIYKAKQYNFTSIKQSSKRSRSINIVPRLPPKPNNNAHHDVPRGVNTINMRKPKLQQNPTESTYSNYKDLKEYFDK